jgi:hypothetical protein
MGSHSLVSELFHFVMREPDYSKNGGTKVELMPSPLSLNVCGLSGALSSSRSSASNRTVPEGLKEMSMMQALYGATLFPVQVSLLT